MLREDFARAVHQQLSLEMLSTSPSMLKQLQASLQKYKIIFSIYM